MKVNVEVEVACTFRGTIEGDYETVGDFKRAIERDFGEWAEDLDLHFFYIEQIAIREEDVE